MFRRFSDPSTSALQSRTTASHFSRPSTNPGKLCGRYGRVKTNPSSLVMDRMTSKSHLLSASKKFLYHRSIRCDQRLLVATVIDAHVQRPVLLSLRPCKCWRQRTGDGLNPGNVRRPASTGSATPVTSAASSDAKNNTAWLIDPGAIRP